jgi:phosphonate transport system substrate-binding protein
MAMIRTLRFLVTLSVMLITIGAANAREEFTIGVAPHTSARVIMEMYQPLRLSLEKALGMPVTVITAPDFDIFVRRALNQEYDLAITTGHQARLLQVDAGYLPLVTYKAQFKAVALVAADGPIRTAADLKGKPVLGLSPSSQVTLWGEHWLSDNVPGATAIRYVSASDSVAQLVIAGEAAAGFISLANFQKLPSDVQARLRILAESRAMLGRVYLLNSRRAARKNAIEATLWGFAGTAEGKKYFEVNRLEGYRALNPNELKAMDTYANEVRKQLKTGDK